MKTKFSRTLALTVIAFLVIVITSSKKSRAAEPISGSKVTEFSDVKHINKIEVKANVEVFLDQGETGK